MKKFLFTLFWAMIAFSASAQYFHNYYEPATMNSGLVTVASGDGHLMAGIMDDDAYFGIIRTNKSGVFSIGNFRKQYYVSYNSHAGTITGVEAIEYDDGLGYGVLGSFRTAYSEYGLFFAKLDLSGNVLATHYLGYADEMTINAACVSHQRTRHMFGTGVVAGDKFFYIEIDSTGTRVNGYIFSVQQGYSPPYPGPGGPCPNPDEVIPHDIVESIFADPNDGEYYVIIVGSHLGGPSSGSSAQINGYFMPIKPSIGIGGPNRVERRIGSNNTFYEYFTGVTAASDGYIISGILFDQNTNGGWLMKVTDNGDPYYSTAWSNIYYSPNTNANDDFDLEFFDVVEYQGMGQYYVIGRDYIHGTNSSLAEIMMVASSNGTVASGTYYDQGVPSMLEPVTIDIDYSMPGDGVALYSYTNDVISAPSDMSLRKVRFNGQYDCDNHDYNPTADEIDFYTGTSYGYGEAWDEGEISVTQGDEVDYQVNCFTEGRSETSRSTGVKKEVKKSGESGVCEVYPNPASPNDEVRLDLSSLNTTVAEITIYSISGALLYSNKVDLTQGKTIPLPLRELNLNRGIFMIRLVSGDQIQSIPLVIH